MKKRILSLLLTLLMLAGTVLLAQSVAASQFNDVSEKRWSYNDIMYTYGKGYMNGYPDGSFKPEESMSRAMIVTVLYRMEGEPEVTAKNPFGDVKSGKWYTDAVIWGAEKGIVSGISKTKFGPDEKVTREQLVTFFARFAENVRSYDISKTADLSAYTDSGKISSYAKDYFAWAVATGLVNGKTATTLDPRGNATREQFAAILQRFDNTEFEYQLLYNPPREISRYTEKEYSLVKDADIYVAVDGDDENPGTFDRPVATFERAKEIVRGLKDNADAVADGKIVVAFKAGNYGNLNIEFTAEDSGTDEVPIIYCAYGDGEVNFNNGIIIGEEEFEPISEEEANTMFSSRVADSIFKYDLNGKVSQEEISKTFLLTESGVGVIARYPNEGSNSTGMLKRGSDTEEDEFYHPSYTAYIQMPLKKRVDGYHTYENMRIIGTLHYDWYEERANVESYDRETGQFVLTNVVYGLSADTGYWSDKPFYIENVSEELDNAGEYFVDVNTMTLYVFKPEGEYSMPTAGTFVKCHGASDITFRGMNFKCTTGRAFDIGNNSSDITLELCNMSYVGAEYAVNLAGVGHKVLSCELSNLCGGGINSTVDNPVYWNELISGGKVIDNNYIHDIGLIYKSYRVGINSSYDVGLVISHNEITNTPHMAINYYSINTIIEYNVFDNANREFGDAGTIYSGGTLVQNGNIIRYNIFRNTSPSGKHIYLDDGLSGQTIYGNIFYGRCAQFIMVSGGRVNKIYENIFIDPGETEGTLVHFWAKYLEKFRNEGDITKTKWLFDELRKGPAAGSAESEKWREAWPWLYSIHADVSNSDDPDFFVNPSYCVFRDNYAVTGGRTHTVAEDTVRLGTVYNNPEFTPDENPLFVNPTIGDYRIRDHVDTSVIEKIPYIPYELIGRY